jgi:hypothetical protein
LANLRALGRGAQHPALMRMFVAVGVGVTSINLLNGYPLPADDPPDSDSI